MLTTYDIASVRRFANEVEDRQSTCSGKSSFCSDLDRHLQCLAEVCQEWLAATKAWAVSVFRGESEFDAQVESAFKDGLRDSANRSRPHLTHGWEVKSACNNLQALSKLDGLVAEIDAMLEKWVQPKLSVTASPRIGVTEEVAALIAEKVSDLPELPPDWKPSDPRQERLHRESPRN